jgi:hypothetical protein
MACYTVTQVVLEDDAWLRKARANLKLPETGALTEEHATAAGLVLEGRYGWEKSKHLETLVRDEAGVLKGMATIRRLDPRAVVRRKGNKLHVSVQR